jgi:hypothetical protein
MADDPWGQFVEKPNDPWAQFTAPPATAQTPPASSSSASSSAAATPGVAAWLPGSQTLSNMSRTFDDAMTFGGADYATAKVGAALHSLLGLPNVPSADDLRAQTASASAALPAAVRIPTEIAGYAMGPGPAGAEALGLRGVGLVRGALGGAAEGAAASGLGAAGHGGSLSDVEGAAEMGGATGAVAGGLGGAFSRGPKPQAPAVGQPQSSTGPATGMYASKVSAYAPLDNIYFDNPAYSGAINQAQTAIGNVRDPQGLGVDLGIPKDVNDIVTKLYREPVATGRVIQQASQDLRSTGDWTAHRFADALDNTLNTAQPMTGGQAGDAGAAKNAGDYLYGRINDLERLGDDPTQLTKGAISKTASYYPTQPGVQPGPEAQSLSTLQNAVQPPFNWWHVRHMAAPVIGAGLGAAEGFFNPAEKQNPYLTAATQALEGGVLFSGLPAGAAAIGRARAANALAGARYAIGTGQAAPAATLGPGGNALRNLLFGPGASGY